MYNKDTRAMLLHRLAMAAYESGDYEKCLDCAKAIGGRLPQDLKEPVSISSYRLGVKLVAHDQFNSAKERLTLARDLSTQAARRRLCEDRLVLVKHALSRPRLQASQCPVCCDNPAVQRARAFAREGLLPEVDEVHCIGAYRSGWDRECSNPFSRALRDMKTADGRILLEPLGDLLAHFFVAHLGSEFRARIDLLAPVPTSPSRYANRGHSIPEILGSRVAQQTAIPSYPKLVQLTRETRDLRYLSKAERRQELDGAFEITQPEMVNGYSIAIIDDITTHGTTLREIARTLRSHGAREVTGVVLAHTEPSGG